MDQVRIGREDQLPPCRSPTSCHPGFRDLVHYQKHDVAYEHFRCDVGALVETIIIVRRHVRRGQLIGGVESRNTRVLPGFYRVCS